jgi:replicative superfamily II helicase
LAKFLLERAAMENETDAFLPSNITIPSYQAALRKVKTARSREIFELFQKGIGVHHAGLIRQDRLLMEKMFSEGHIKVLCCTATLAWGIVYFSFYQTLQYLGVNLPAHAVIIRVSISFQTYLRLKF